MPKKIADTPKLEPAPLLKVKKKRKTKPHLHVPEHTVTELAKNFCTQQEIADILGISVDTLHNKFSDCIKKGRAQFKGDLRAAQRHKAIVESDTKMQIWLGKQVLGQSDKIETFGTNFNLNVNPEKEASLNSKFDEFFAVREKVVENVEVAILEQKKA